MQQHQQANTTTGLWRSALMSALRGSIYFAGIYSELSRLPWYHHAVSLSVTRETVTRRGLTDTAWW